MAIHDVDPTFAKIVFPKMIEDNKDYLLLTFDEHEEKEGVNVTLRSGGPLFRDETGELDMSRVIHYLQGAMEVFDDSEE